MPNASGKSCRLGAPSSNAAIEATVSVFVPPFSDCSAGTSGRTTFEDVRSTLEDFANARDWRQYHTPRNLCLALAGEVGEVAELFQWRTDDDCRDGLAGFEPAKRDAVADELADVLAYLVRLSSACGIDLAAAFQRKMAANNAKYPAELARGSAAKYTELRDAARRGRVEAARRDERPVHAGKHAKKQA